MASERVDLSIYRLEMSLVELRVAYQWQLEQPRTQLKRGDPLPSPLDTVSGPRVAHSVFRLQMEVRKAIVVKSRFVLATQSRANLALCSLRVDLLQEVVLLGKSVRAISWNGVHSYHNVFSHTLSIAPYSFSSFGRSIEMKVGYSDYHHNGGHVKLAAGEAKGNAVGGSVDIAAGSGTSSKGRGGSVSITAGDASGKSPFDAAGHLTMNAGSANKGVGGAVTIQSGGSTEKDSGAIGKLIPCGSACMQYSFLSIPSTHPSCTIFCLLFDAQ